MNVTIKGKKVKLVKGMIFKRETSTVYIMKIDDRICYVDIMYKHSHRVNDWSYDNKGINIILYNSSLTNNPLITREKILKYI